jgi:hypothetical protein
MCLNGTSCKVRRGKYFFETFPTQNDLKQEVLLPLIYNFALEYAIMNDVSLLGDNTGAIKKNTRTLIDASNEVGLEVNADRTKYMLLSLHQECRAKL